MTLTRRTLLVAAGATVALAGCTDSTSEDGDDGADTPTGTDTPTPDGPYGGPDGWTGEAEADVFHLPITPSRPLWAVADDAKGFVTLLEDDYDDLWMVDNPDEVEGLRAWLDETAPTDSLVYLQTAGPSTCYSRVAVNDIGIENGGIVGTASAVDTSEADEMCGAALTYPSALVRVSADESPEDVNFTVTDGWGESAKISADGRYVDPERLPGHVRPDGDPPQMAEFSCEGNDFQRLDGPENVAMGEVHDDEELSYAMRVRTGTEKPRVGRGDEVTVTLWNVSTDTHHTGNRDKWTLQSFTTDGWQTVFGADGDAHFGYTDEAIEHRPGKAFEWSFEMTEKCVLSEHVHGDRLRVCPDLPAGRYRFVYHGIVSAEPLAVEFHYQN
ncbi:hypothetical protein [Halovenus salina]|uniref:Uncharacterized protein n=1 Tax=Halovenus salina TaxID=1510225 RepID=A0ABD5VX69_9EURY|nr:hypothetical protein [Halovenus salina]